jgi:hypothetical protein
MSESFSEHPQVYSQLPQNISEHAQTLCEMSQVSLVVNMFPSRGVNLRPISKQFPAMNWNRRILTHLD